MFTNEYFSDRVSARTRGRGVSQMQTAADRGKEGGQKSLKMCEHPLWMAPSVHKMVKNIKNHAAFAARFLMCV